MLTVFFPVVQVFREARRTVPSVVYMPHIGEWWEAVSETVRATFLTLLQDIPSFSPILLLSTSETVYGELPEEVSKHFICMPFIHAIVCLWNHKDLVTLLWHETHYLMLSVPPPL